MTERQRAKRDGRCRIDMQRAKHNGDGCVICRSTITSTPDWTAPAALVLVLALPCARPTDCRSAAASAANHLQKTSDIVRAAVGCNGGLGRSQITPANEMSSRSMQTVYAHTVEETDQSDVVIVWYLPGQV